VRETYTVIDSGVWMARRAAFWHVGGLDEALAAWGHAQTHFQWKLHTSGVEFVRIPEILFYHPLHAAERDIALAHEQLRGIGIDIHKMWERYEGAKPY
jgi:GT2 family glycosyltransferase